MKILRFFFSFALLVATATSAAAQASVLSSVEPAVTSQRGLSHQRGGWEYAFEPYLWFAGIDGHAGLGRVGPFGVDMDFGGIWENMSFGAMLAFEAGPRDKPWSILLDSLYLDLEAEKRGIEFGYEQGFLEGTIAWKVPYQPETQILAGVRAWALEPSIEMPSGSMIAVEEEWVDPILGLRYVMPANTEYDMYLRADVGGFGLGSDLTWQAAVGLRWHLNQNADFGLGYRHMQLEYDRHDVDLDVAFSGPLIGLSWGN